MEDKKIQNPVLKEFPKRDFKRNFYLILTSLLVVLVGVSVGWLLSGKNFTQQKSDKGASTNVKKSDSEAGIENESMFSESESPEGILKEGGIEGEGTHHLERPGGASQTVYLASTVIDLQSFIDKKVKVWGETLSGVRAGWLMDVGKIKVIE